ncbi:DUF11 domain-containing protein, partial [Lacihabitans sp. LS3-19]|uniref:Ig-like domain-containing protein n=1 Tax=Lacihabitans sp. LS3-19 TaxID=2487335 RepID=UPI0020CBA611
LSGNVTFTPEPTFVTDPTPIDYVLIEKSTGLDSTATIFIDVIEEQPVAVNDTSSNNPIGVPVVINIIANDSLSSGFNPNATQVSVDLNPSLPGIQDTLIVAGEGMYVYDSLSGNVTFTPEPTFVTDPTPIDYVLIEKSTGLDSTATIFIDVIEEQPVAVNDSSLNNPYGSIVVINIIKNDTLSTGLNPSSNQIWVDLDINTPGIQDTLIVLGEGTFVYDSLTGQVTFTPENNFNGNPNPITYNLVEKGTGLSDLAEIKITYTGADLILFKIVNTQDVNVGDTITFTIKLHNAGPSVATNVQIKDALPIGFSGISNITSNGSYINDSITWEIGNLNVNADTSFTYTAIVNAPSGNLDEYKNIAQVTESDQVDPNSTPNNYNGNVLENDEAFVIIVPKQSDLSIKKSINNPSPVVGEIVTFQIRVKNDGPDDATGVEVKDYLPNGFDNVANISNGGFYLDSNIVWSNLSISNGDSLILSFTVKVKPFADTIIYNNIAEVTWSNQYDPDSRVANYSGLIAEDEESIVCVIPGVLSDTSICAGTKFELPINMGSNYVWSGPNGFTYSGDTLIIPNVDISKSGIYSVEITNGSGCSAIKSFNLTVNGLPNVVVEPTNSGCQGTKSMNNGKITVSAFDLGSQYQISQGTSFNFGNAGVKQVIPANGIILNNISNVTQTYTVRVYNSSDCYNDYTVDMIEIGCNCPAEICIPFIIKKVK